MKNWILLGIAALTSSNLSAAPLKVVATLPLFADIAKKIGGDLVEVSSLAKPNQDPHFVIPTPTLMKKARNAQVFIENGLSLELWAQKIIDAADNSNIRSAPGRVIASKGVTALEVPEVLTRADGDVHPGGNPHVWLDPLNAKIIAKNISDSFAKIDSKNAATYASRLKQFNADIDTKMAGWLKKAASLKDAKIITYHKSFVYFAKRFGFTIAGEIEEKPGMTPSARHRDVLIELVKKEKINKIVLELYYDRKYPDFIAEKTGAKVEQVPIDVGADPMAMDYFSLIDLLLERFTSVKNI